MVASGWVAAPGRMIDHVGTMYETEEQIRELQSLIDTSFRHGGEYMLWIMAPERRLNAKQIVKYLQGTKHIALATVTSKGEPRVSPLDGHFLRGRFYFGTASGALRAKHMARQPAVSLTHFVGDDIAIIIHGNVHLIEKGDEQWEALDGYYAETYGSSPSSWRDDVLFAWVEPQTMLAYAQHPENYPES